LFFLLAVLGIVLLVLCYYQEYSIDLLWAESEPEETDKFEILETDEPSKEDCDFSNTTDVWTNFYDNILEYF